jgi:hypothetical protein
MIYQCGGTIDVVIGRFDDALPIVGNLDMGLYDHYLMLLSVTARRLPCPVVIVQRRPWRSLDVELFYRELIDSPLCQSDIWPSSIDDLANLYDRELALLFHRLMPLHLFIRRSRPFNLWFDCKCRDAKRLTCRFERT